MELEQWKAGGVPEMMLLLLGLEFEFEGKSPILFETEQSKESRKQLRFCLPASPATESEQRLGLD